MGRVDKGINCSVDNCGNQAERSMSGIKAGMAPDLGLGGSKRVYLCRDHYKEWKKLTKEDRENERARWA
ncbi:MAG: hypothetical protein M3M89_01455 [Thermoproteota archaeon]|jgi:hypothetical protein|nr:hypothetical protein [Nitrososphaera sp.]MDP8888280.1 hypothetical protein [Thermoproteota archaeon]MDP8903017.1 hypothetical protein [Thermoproteota archaeon]MDQ3948652.1 hypothetical protein [Thermoproteota archaeon]MDQ3969640.1 hypothetical protein [Thermoproteota archaeon]